MTLTHIPASCVHLWFAAVTDLDDPRHSAAAWAVLSTSEKRHAARFQFARDRNSFLTSRSLRRHVLSHYAAVAPSQWQFTSNQHGRPGIAYPLTDDPLEFNSSKSGDLVVCAVTRGVGVGVDIERLDRPVSAGLVESIFSPREIVALQALPLSDRNKRLLTHWTLKEAYVKARGLGLSIPLDSVAFTVSDSPRPAACLESSVANDCDAWQFTLLAPTRAHIAAVCVQRQHGPDPKIVMRWVSVTQIPASVIFPAPR